MQKVVVSRRLEQQLSWGFNCVLKSQMFVLQFLVLWGKSCTAGASPCRRETSREPGREPGRHAHECMNLPVTNATLIQIHMNLFVHEYSCEFHEFGRMSSFAALQKIRGTPSTDTR